MDFSIRVLEQPEQWQPLMTAWNRLVAEPGDSALGMDVTCTHEWAMTLWENHLGRQNLQVLTIERNGALGGLLPVYRFRKKIHGIPCRCLAPIQELYSGRCGLLLDEPRGDNVRELFRHIWRKIPGWDIFQITLVQGSRSEALLLAQAKTEGVAVESISDQRSPYMVIEGTIEDYLASLSQKFRWRLRNSEKKLRAQGELRFECFRNGNEMERFLAAVTAIEKESWKEKEGSSITANPVQESFYARILPVAARAGWFSGCLLSLNQEPIAYGYGLVFQHIFHDLKSSYKNSYRSLAPGNVARILLMQELVAEGVNIYDFMGTCEDHKMRWTDKTYNRITYILYGPTLVARAAQVGARIAPLLRRKPEAKKPVPERQEE